MVALEGIEPSYPCGKQFLKLPRLPFRHRAVWYRRQDLNLHTLTGNWV